jgi:hypothetical protein
MIRYIVFIIFSQLVFSQNLYCVKLYYNTHGSWDLVDNPNEIVQITNNNFSSNPMVTNILSNSYQSQDNVIEFSFPNENSPPVSIRGYYYNPGKYDEDRDGDGIINGEDELRDREEYILNTLTGVSSEVERTFTEVSGVYVDDFFTNFHNYSIKVNIMEFSYSSGGFLVSPHTFLFFQF